MSKHTPGPWAYDELWDSISANEGGIDVATICYDALEDSHIANARLIAAAPELLEALKNLKIAGGCFCGKHGPIPEDLHANYCRKAMAAIAKAEGKTE